MLLISRQNTQQTTIFLEKVVTQSIIGKSHAKLHLTSVIPIQPTIITNETKRVHYTSPQGTHIEQFQSI